MAEVDCIEFKFNPMALKSEIQATKLRCSGIRFANWHRNFEAALMRVRASSGNISVQTESVKSQGMHSRGGQDATKACKTILIVKCTAASAQA